jgi:hypothetical protein
MSPAFYGCQVGNHNNQVDDAALFIEMLVGIDFFFQLCFEK